MLILLDLSAAFDNHSTLLNHLENWLGVRNTALTCYSSYLSHRSFSMVSSCSALLLCGVSQGSILGSLLFSIFMLGPNQHKINFHCYADDTQPYVQLKDNHNSGVIAYLTDITCWTSQNFLLLNDAKWEVVLFSPSNLTILIERNLGNINNNIKLSVQIWGVIFDYNLCLEQQITKTVQCCFLHLRNLNKI